MNISFKNKIVIITGCNGYLGKELCINFLKNEALVIGIDKAKKNSLKVDNFKYLCIDIRDENKISKNFNRLFKKNLKPNVLINNAALSYKGIFNNRKQVEIQNMIEVNLAGSFNMIKKFNEVCENNANIVNIASIYGIISPKPDLYKKNKIDNSEIYGATKAGIIQMTKYFARYLNSKKIRVNSVSPGGIYTKDNIDDKYFIKEYIKDVPLRRLAYLQDIINPILFLSSDNANYINGHNLIIDGGKSC